MKALKEIIYWTLALFFAGVMLIGAVAEFDVTPWAVGIVKVTLFLVVFEGCAWASNKTALGTRIAGKDSF